MHIEINERALFFKKVKTVTFSLQMFCFGILYFIYYLERIYLIKSNPLVFNILDMVEWPIYFIIFLNAIIKNKYKNRDIVLMFVVGLIFLTGYVVTGYAELLKAMMIIVALKNVDYHELFDVMYRILGSSIVLTVLLYLLGLSDAGIQRRGANALGYAQANSVGYVLMVLTLLTIVKKDKISLRDKMLLAVLNFLGFIISDCRTGFFLACTALLFSNKRVYGLIKRNRFIQIFLTVLPWVLMMFTILISVLYESSVYVQRLDVVFNARIAMNYLILKDSGITLFGHPVEYHGLTTEAIYNPVKGTWSTYMTIDSAYMCLIIEFGLLATIVVGIAYYKLIKKLFRYDAINIVFVMSILSLYGFTESSLLSIYVAFPFLLLLNDKLKDMETRTEYDS